VHGATMEYMPHYDQCAYARDVSICEICASQVSRNHVKLSERVIGGTKGGFVQLCNFRSIFPYYLKFCDSIKNKCENYETMIEKCKNMQGDTNLVWSHAKIIFNSLYQSGGARCYNGIHAPLRPMCLCKGRLHM
jgi:hypothetical protein